MKTYLKLPAAILFLMLLFSSCKKDKAPEVKHASVNNTSWLVTLTVTGNTSTQNIFEFSNNGAYFSWHPAGAPSYNGTWTQEEATVNFTFNETTATGDYVWDNTGTLSENDTVLTGTMQRRGAQGSGTFTAKKM